MTLPRRSRKQIVVVHFRDGETSFCNISEARGGLSFHDQSFGEFRLHRGVMKYGVVEVRGRLDPGDAPGNFIFSGALRSSEMVFFGSFPSDPWVIRRERTLSWNRSNDW